MGCVCVCVCVCVCLSRKKERKGRKEDGNNNSIEDNRRGCTEESKLHYRLFLRYRYTMQVTYVAHDSFYLSLSFSLSDKSVSVTSKFISLSPTIIHVVSPNQIKIFPTCLSYKYLSTVEYDTLLFLIYRTH